MEVLQVWTLVCGGVFAACFISLLMIKQHKFRITSAIVASVFIWTASIAILHYSKATGHSSWFIFCGMLSLPAFSVYLAALPSFQPQDTAKDELDGDKSLDEDTQVD